MAFPRSQRFVEKETCAPPPTAYHVPSYFDENNCSAWVRPCTYDHRCGQCANNKSHDSSVQSHKSSERGQVPSHMRQRACTLSYGIDNNLCCFQKKDGSNIPRFKKNLNQKLTEPKAPSFMTRPRHSNHNCFVNRTDDTETSFSTTIFNRHSLNRKSIKMVKDRKEKISNEVKYALSPLKGQINSDLQDDGHLNVSYIICSKSDDKLENENNVLKIPTTSTLSPITFSKRLSNVTDDMKESETLPNLNTVSLEDNSSCTKYPPTSNLELFDFAKEKILEKKDSKKELLNILNDIKNTDTNKASYDTIVSSEKLEETAKKGKIGFDNITAIKMGSENKEKYPKSCHVSPDVESHVVFLITDEFIDDEYDSYISDQALEKLQKVEDGDLLQICKFLIHMYLGKFNVSVPKKRVVLRVKGQGGLKKMTKTKTAKMVKKKKKIINNATIWSDVEKLIRCTITELKGEFKNEIYRKTEEKVDILLAKLAKVLLKAEDDIDTCCERATNALINKLEKIVNI